MSTKHELGTDLELMLVLPCVVVDECHVHERDAPQEPHHAQEVPQLT